MAYNKVIYNNNTLIDLTGDDVVESDVAEGKLFHKANGEQAVGTGSGGQQELFWCEYNVTTSQQIYEQMQANKMPMVKISDRFYFCNGGSSAAIGFMSLSGYPVAQYTVIDATWRRTDIGSYETTSRFSQIIANQEFKYPSCKAVYNYSQPKLTAGTGISIDENNVISINLEQSEGVKF